MNIEINENLIFFLQLSEMDWIGLDRAMHVKIDISNINNLFCKPQHKQR